MTLPISLIGKAEYQAHSRRLSIVLQCQLEIRLIISSHRSQENEGIGAMAESVWGIHMKKMDGTSKPINEGFIGIGWETIGEEICSLPDDRGQIKACIRKEYLGAKAGRIRAHASVLQNFLYGISIGDLVVYSDRRKPTPMVNIGRVTGGHKYSEEDSPYPNRRTVMWIMHLPRTNLTESAKNAIRAGNIRYTVYKIHLTSKQFLSDLGISE